ncbi:MAG: NAD-dependent epimerase/dehydratase family protein [Chitinophagaceae bacterium]
MKILLTGATGFIGNHLLKALLLNGHNVHVTIRDKTKKNLVDFPGVTIFETDLSNHNSLTDAIKDCDQVYHTAAYAKLWAPNENIFYSTNVDGTYHLLKLASESGVKKFVYTSSAAVLGNSINTPLNENDPRIIGFSNGYDISKYIAEKIVKDFNNDSFHTVIVNPTRVFGGGVMSYSNAISRMIHTFLNNGINLVPGCLDIIANYGYIDDVVTGHILAMEKGRGGERYIIGGENISYRDFYQTVFDLTNKEKIIRLPLGVMKFAGYINLVLHYFFGKEPAFTPFMIERYFKNTALSSEKAISELGYQITPFRSAMQQTISFIKENMNENK